MNSRNAVATTQQGDRSLEDTLQTSALVLGSGLLGGAAGAAFGRHSLLVGLPIVLYGIFKRNNYLMAAGLSFTLCNGFQVLKKSTTQPSQELSGFDFKQIFEDAKDRVGTYFKNFGEKLYLPQNTESPEPQVQQPITNGLGETEDQVTYFINPYSDNELDLSAMDRIQEQIAIMSASGSPQSMEQAMNDVDQVETSEEEILEDDYQREEIVEENEDDSFQREF